MPNQYHTCKYLHVNISNMPRVCTLVTKVLDKQITIQYEYWVWSDG